MKKFFIPAAFVSVLVIGTVFAAPALTRAAVYLTLGIGGGAYTGCEQQNEASQVSSGMSSAGGNGGVSGYTDCGTNYFSDTGLSFFQFNATNGVYFTVDGTNIGSAMTIVHKDDWVGIAPSICAKMVQAVQPGYACGGETPPCSSGATSAMVTSGMCCGTIVNTVDSSNCSFASQNQRSTNTLQVNRTPGVCGSSNGGSFSSAPSANLCSTGSASAVYDYGYWSWSCTGVANAQVSCQAAKTVPAPTLTFYADNTSVAYNAGTNLHWSSTNATSCSASGNWSAAQPTSGSAATGSLTSSPTYYLTCSGPGGSIMNTVTVNVAALPTVQIQFN